MTRDTQASVHGMNTTTHFGYQVQLAPPGVYVLVPQNSDGTMYVVFKHQCGVAIFQIAYDGSDAIDVDQPHRTYKSLPKEVRAANHDAQPLLEATYQALNDAVDLRKPVSQGEAEQDEDGGGDRVDDSSIGGIQRAVL